MKATAADAGFTGPRELQTLAVFIPESQVKEPERVVRMHQEILRTHTPRANCRRFASSSSSRISTTRG